jgi:phage gp45-like
MNFIRGLITGIVEGTIRAFSASGRSNETFSNREIMQHYGFASSPLAGAAGLIAVGKDGQVYLIASDDSRYRVTLEAGEVVLYTSWGDKLHFHSGGQLEIIADNGMKITTPTLTVSGNLNVGGNVADGTGTMAAMRQTYNSHTHTNSAGVTGTPSATM